MLTYDHVSLTYDHVPYIIFSMHFVEFLVQGLGIGVLYGLIALPLSLVYATTDSVDLAVGGYAVIAGMIAVSLGGVAGGMVGVAAALALGTGMGLIYQGLRRRGTGEHITPTLASLGLVTAVASFVLFMFGPNPRFRSMFDNNWQVGGVRISPQSVVNLVVVGAVLGASLLVIYRTPIGRTMRACAVNAKDATLVGIPVGRVQVGVFAVAGLLSGIAGLLAVTTRGVSFDYSLPLGLLGFGALIIFGMRGPSTAVTGGLVLGIVEGLSAGYLPSAYSLIAPQAFILLVLASGAFGKIQGARA